MRRDDALATLRSHGDEWRALGAASLAIFGSVARDEATDTSDVDILVELARPMGLFGFIALKTRLEEVLGVRVDLVTPDALPGKMLERVRAEALRAA